MKSVADLQNKFGVEDLVTVETGRGGQTCVKLTGRETPARVRQRTWREGDIDLF